MFYRQSLDTTLTQLHDILQERRSADPIRVSPDEVHFHLDATDPSISFRDLEIPASKETMAVVGNALSVPSSFMKRLQDSTSGSTQNAVLGEMLVNTIQKDLSVQPNQSNSMVTEILEWENQGRRIRPHQIAARIRDSFGGTTDPLVARLVDENHQFAFDAYVPFDNPSGVGGDPAVNDLTAAGVRIDVNLKQGLAPSVQPFTYRRICTNGMETPMAGLKIDARGQTVDEVLMELEGMARIAFGQAERDIQHFYELREQRVDNPERAITAIARERGIPDRSTVEIIRLAAGEDLPDNPSMFDVVNLITNFANSPQVRNDGGRLLLERAGGAVVSDHAARCGHCAQRVTE